MLGLLIASPSGADAESVPMSELGNFERSLLAADKPAPDVISADDWRGVRDFEPEQARPPQRSLV